MPNRLFEPPQSGPARRLKWPIIPALTLTLLLIGLAGCNAPPSSTNPTPSLCDAPGTKEVIRQIIEEGPDKTLAVKLLDIGNFVERFYDEESATRYCGAEIATSAGSGLVSYKIYFGPSGQELTELREGRDAYGADDLAAAQRKQAGQGDSATETAAAGERLTAGPPTIDGKSYAAARAWLMREWFQPIPRASGEYCGADPLCERYPETDACAGDAPLCVMRFRAVDGRELQVRVQTEPTQSVLGSEWVEGEPIAAAPPTSSPEISPAMFDGDVGGADGEEYLACPTLAAARGAIRTASRSSGASAEARYDAFRTVASRAGCRSATGPFKVVQTYESLDFQLDDNAGAYTVVALRARSSDQKELAILYEALF